MAVQRRRLRVRGTVQGVGFRPFVYREAVALGVDGQVGNDAEGVVVEAQGDTAALDELARRIGASPPPLARVVALESRRVAVHRDEHGFRIVESDAQGDAAVPVSVDVATCDDCLGELFDPHDRRHRYPFLNCTNCGPRYTIVRGVPYDRPLTTMAAFPMCAECRREYEDPADRRFHAQPIACPSCGPTLILRDAAGAELCRGEDALQQAAHRLVHGEVVAVKGLGGFHLATDATREDAMTRLRRRKARDDKPFAVMVRDLDMARGIARVDEAAEVALRSPRRPIVLLPRRIDATLARQLAPGLDDVGVMLAYTPLHHLLLDAVRRPLVMTSANRSDEPIAYRDADLASHVGALVDAVLTHDRDIHVRCDDSVLRAGVDGGTQMVRRSRGYAPQPMPLPGAPLRQVLATGSDLKNTLAVTRDGTVIASHHVGDLEHPAAYRSFTEAAAHLCTLFGVEPEAVACDLHPDFHSSGFARGLGLPVVAVQHHHAHVASCLVEHGRTAPVLGIAFDGFGLGDDGTMWGGELLVADLHGYRRAGHLRTVPLPGGDAAAREPWRMGLSWLRSACGDGAALAWASRHDARAEQVLRAVASEGTAQTSSAGRLFDAVAALLDIRDRTSFEGQAAIELEAAARRHRGSVPHLEIDVVDEAGQFILDPRPLVAAIAAAAPDSPGDVAALAAAFHDALARAVADAACRTCAREQLDTVALTGGVFQNATLTQLLLPQLRRAGLRVLLHREVPPNDGGISIGQAAIAASAGVRD